MIKVNIEIEGMEVRVGEMFLGRFLVEKELGQGGFGQVFAAVDTYDGSRVALKISQGDYNNIERGIIEAHILDAIRNSEPHYRRLVVEMKTYFVLESCDIVVLELLSHSLLKYRCDGQFDSYEKISMLANDMVEFLHSMFQLNVIHGDIKPENILVDHSGNGIKFADFGLAHCPFVGKKETDIQTLVYRSPEVILGYDYDGSVDTWSAGCVLAACILHNYLFPVSDDLELMQLLARVIGTPTQEVIRNAPKRDRLFDYDVKSRMWIMKGFDSPVAPMGLKRYLETHHNVCDDTPGYFMLLDLLERMLKLNPRERITPKMCFSHPFLNIAHNYSNNTNARRLRQSSIALSTILLGILAVFLVLRNQRRKRKTT